MPDEIQTEGRLTAIEKDIGFLKEDIIPRMERKIDKVGSSVDDISKKIDKICANNERQKDKDGNPEERRVPPEPTTREKWKDMPWWKKFPIIILLLGVITSTGIFWLDKLILILEGLKSFLGP